MKATLESNFVLGIQLAVGKCKAQGKLATSNRQWANAQLKEVSKISDGQSNSYECKAYRKMMIFSSNSNC